MCCTLCSLVASSYYQHATCLPASNLHFEGCLVTSESLVFVMEQSCIIAVDQRVFGWCLIYGMGCSFDIVCICPLPTRCCVCVQIQLSVWWAETRPTRVVWRCTTVTSGAPCVTTTSRQWRLTLSAVSQGIREQRPTIVRPILDKELVSSCNYRKGGIMPLNETF